MRIDDEILEFGSESTLLSLRNGGGKSVLVQMLTAPFVHKRYRDTKDRPFESYFTTTRPTYILVEWSLDGGAGFVLTGMVVRRNVNQSEETSSEPLEILQFIHEYKERNEYDIYRFPLVEQEASGKKLRGFHQTKLLFEELKRGRGFHFNFYDMNQPSQSRSYFDKLKDYGINHKEWESIVKKVNLKESGLSELFADAKDEYGLIDKWFLSAVEDKLSKDENRIQKFIELVTLYLKQYKENQEKFQRKEIIEQFREDTTVFLETATIAKNQKLTTESMENEIANLMEALRQNLSHMEITQAEYKSQLEKLEDELRTIEHEELSYEIHQLIDELKFQQDTLLQKEKAISLKKKEKEEVQKKKNLQECAKLYQDYEAAYRDKITLESQLDLAKKKDEDLAPERNDLGFTLKVYYDEKKKSDQEKLFALEENQKHENEQLLVLQGKLEEANIKLTEISKQMGNLEGLISSFDEVEAGFNYRYGEHLQRNIIGEYEESFLGKIKESIHTTVQEFTEEIKEKKIKKEANVEVMKAAKRNLEDGQNAYSQEKNGQHLRKVKEAEYEEELRVRKTILPYVLLEEKDLFHTSKILEAFDLKLKEQKNIELGIHSEIQKEEQEYEKLRSGKVLELPKELEEILHDEEIHFIYGMDWLKKNGYSNEQNSMILEKNPFIPYAIILTSSEMDKLSKKNIEYFTSFPIPMVKRESLEKACTKSGHTYEFDAVNFYISFNHNLLDEEGLKVLLHEKKDKLEKLYTQKNIIEEETKFFQDKKSIIEFQRVDEKAYELLKKELSQGEKNLAKMELLIREQKEQLGILEKEQENLQLEIQKLTHILEKEEAKQKEFLGFMERYHSYLENRKKLKALEQSKGKTYEWIADCQNQIKRREQLIKELQNNLFVASRELDHVKEKAMEYEGFSEGTILSGNIEEIKARFDVITKNVRLEQQEIEEKLVLALKILSEKEEEYIHLQKEYGLIEQEVKATSYHRATESQLRMEIRDCEVKISQLQEEKGRIQSAIAKYEANIENGMAKLQEKIGTKELKKREEIVYLQFRDRKVQKFNEKRKVEDQLNSLLSQIKLYEDNLSALYEYEDLDITVPLDINLNVNTLKKYRSELIRDYKESKEIMEQLRLKLTQEIGALLRKELYTDDFFKKPLESLEKLVEKPEELLEQLSTILESYENLLEKIKIDLEFIGEEGDKILDMIFQYVKEVHENLGKIDRNSTITVRGRSIKMLKIKLPDWEENTNQFKLKLKDFMEALTIRGLEKLNQNENIEELVANQITTKNLYHEIVGIGNIGIKLYKIEEEREYPITWAQVSKNSGGEGFLSAFVILSSLLSYMRRDDTDIFVDREEGKVLIMDNPFAQTNASHLLKPLMDIAKKSNTQLICLSGLGGESIYNRFDNIYVLNLVSSKLKNTMQYLRSEHIKGEDLETLVASRVKIETSEQMVLF